MKKVLT